MWIDPIGRRRFLERLGGGFGLLALAGLCEADGVDNPLAPRPPHFPAHARAVISLFMHGGPSHIDTFDPKPALRKLDGQKLPPGMADVELQFTNAREAPLLASRRTFRRCGQSGIEISDLFSHLAAHADDLAVIRSCHHEAFVQSMAMNMVNTGSIRLGAPSVGSWVVYGLGSESRDLPAYIVMLDGPTKEGAPGYSSGFLPATFQGTVMRARGEPFRNVRRPGGISAAEQRDLVERLKRLDEIHLETRRDDTELAARIASYELAFRMQSQAPALADLSRETEATKKLYGLDEPASADFGARCLMARRMVERGVRFIQLYSGGMGDDWDAHDRCDENHFHMARKVDKPIAGLLADLKQRGLLSTTLVVWGGDFGRTPLTDGGRFLRFSYTGGRDHNPYGFTMWMAGGGVKGGKVIGATDEIGFKAVEDPLHIHDVHATMLALLGLDHTRLTYFYQGRDVRLTDVHGDRMFAARLLA